MHPAFPDMVGELARKGLGEEMLDPGVVECRDEAEAADEIAEAIIVAAALQHIAQTRAW